MSCFSYNTEHTCTGIHVHVHVPWSCALEHRCTHGCQEWREAHHQRWRKSEERRFSWSQGNHLNFSGSVPVRCGWTGGLADGCLSGRHSGLTGSWRSQSWSVAMAMPEMLHSSSLLTVIMSYMHYHNTCTFLKSLSMLSNFLASSGSCARMSPAKNMLSRYIHFLWTTIQICTHHTWHTAPRHITHEHYVTHGTQHHVTSHMAHSTTSRSTYMVNYQTTGNLKAVYPVPCLIWTQHSYIHTCTYTHLKSSVCIE